MRWLALVLAVCVAAGWGWSQRRARLRLEVQVENAHQAAFQQLVRQVEGLEQAMDVLAAVQTGSAWREGLAGLRTLAAATAESAAALPLPAQPLARAGAFLDQVEAAAEGWLRDGQGPAPAAQARLRGLGRLAAYLRQDLVVLADLTGSGRLPWAEAAAAAGPDGDGTGLTPINRGLQALEEGWPQAAPYAAPPSDEDGAHPGAGGTDKPLPGTDAADRCAAAFLASLFGQAEAPQALERDATAGLAYYSSRTAAGTRVRLALDGGCRVPYMLAFRPLGPDRLARRQAEAAALAAARRLGLGEVRPVSTEAADGVALVSLAPVAAGRVYFSDAVSLRIALDDGALLGITGRAFFSRPRPRPLPAVRLSAARALVRWGATQAVPGVLTVAGRDVAVYRLHLPGDGAPLDVDVDAGSGEVVHTERHDQAGRWWSSGGP